jgi:chorismate-pyruvate lyase
MPGEPLRVNGADRETREIDPHELSAVQRMLMVTGGTVTEVLETYSGEPIRATKLLEETISPEQAVAALEVSAGEPVLSRKTLLQGAKTHVNLLYAEVTVALDRIGDSFRRKLLETGTPIGQIMKEQRLEVYRELLDSGKRPAGQLAEHFGIDGEAEMIFRTYRMFNQGRPIMIVMETFPESYFLAWYRSLPQRV